MREEGKREVARKTHNGKETVRSGKNGRETSKDAKNHFVGGPQQQTQPNKPAVTPEQT